MNRERLSSRLGFIMLSAGCAIGCGNVWKFPWMCGQYGGGSFVLLYIAFLIVLGLPVLVMEFSVGRASQSSPVQMFQKLQKKGAKWGLWGYVCLLGNVALMAFYAVVCGWMMYYFWKFLSGSTDSLGFMPMITNPAVNVSFLLLTVVFAFAVLSFNLQNGLERITKVMMREGLRFYMVPDFSKINGKVAAAAMNQAFFTLSLGMGSMAIFGSYIDKQRSLTGEALHVIVLDTLVALIAGLIIFPACFSYGIEVGNGPSLLFDTMAIVFTHMAAGRLWGALFFLFMVFAAMSTVLGVCENILAMVRELTGWSRPKGSIVCAAGVFLSALTTALGYSVLHFEPFAPGSAWLDFWDFLVSTNILPLGSLILCLFCCNDSGWGWDNFLKEANEGTGIKISPRLKPLFRFVVPAIILFVYIYGLAVFKWH